MSIEIQMLVWSMLLGIVHVFAPSTLITRERGIGWNASARDQPMPRRDHGRAAAAAQSNFMETFPFFAAAVLAVVLTQRQDGMTAVAVQLYFWARLIYLPLYAAGVPYVRSLVWLVSLLGSSCCCGPAVNLRWRP